jgi:hypothetical protein
MEWVELIVALLSGMAACIPLVVQLIKYIKEAVQSKNWAPLMQIVLKLMIEAEKNYTTGAERKQYVIDSIKSMESTIGYDVDENVIAEMIDSITNATKLINK